MATVTIARCGHLMKSTELSVRSDQVRLNDITHAGGVHWRVTLTPAGSAKKQASVGEISLMTSHGGG